MIRYEPKVGEILQCDFGVFQTDANGNPVRVGSPDNRLKPEMVKNRLVVVLNPKIDGACIVVPLSKIKDDAKVSRGWHVAVEAKLINCMRHFSSMDRWAKADHSQQVSRQRLKMLDGGKQFLSREMVELIQRAVIKSISAASLLKPAMQLPATAQTSSGLQNGAAVIAPTAESATAAANDADPATGST
jgi:uncharacterized protein YifN (PemK superfamily)